MQAQNRAKTVTLPALKVGETCSGKLEPIGATFTKKSGPNWLEIQPDGTYSGTPKDMNAGRNSILVSVKQPDGEEFVLQVRIQVLGADGEVFVFPGGGFVHHLGQLFECDAVGRVAAWACGRGGGG